MAVPATAAGSWPSQVVANPVVEQVQLAGQAVRVSGARLGGEIAEQAAEPDLLPRWWPSS